MLFNVDLIILYVSSHSFIFLNINFYTFCNCYFTNMPCHCFLLLSRFIQGTYAEAPYAFYHWQYIDIFNYFTHNMVTIPPAVWTNAAHKHGVLVLGEQKDKITNFRLWIQSFMICLSSTFSEMMVVCPEV